MNKSNQFINSIERIKDFLHVKTDEEKEDLQNNIKHLKKDLTKLLSTNLIEKLVKKDDPVIQLTVHLYSNLVNIRGDLKDINALIKKTINFKE